MKIICSILKKGIIGKSQIGLLCDNKLASDRQHWKTSKSIFQEARFLNYLVFRAQREMLFAGAGGSHIDSCTCAIFNKF